VALCYLAVGVVWIYFSDQAVSLIAAGDAATIERLQRFKGIGYVVVTCGLIFGLVGWLLRLRDRALEERRDLQRAFDASARFEVLGQLSAAMAHDFRNALTAIQGAAQLGKLTGAPDEAFELISRSVRSANANVDHLLGLVRNEPQPEIRFDLVEWLREHEPLLAQAATRAVRLVCSLPPHPVPVVGSPGRLLQALVNLVLNARDAMAQSPRKRLNLALTVDRGLRAPRSSAGAARGCGYARLAVSDTGQGIPPEQLARIWEPLFTTKAATGGTGLGLTSAQRTVEAHGGWMEVESEVGQGTTFHLFLPLAPAEAEAPTAEQSAPAEAEPTPRVERG
jgi:two-component system cell cycle sensor histidine kinase/response regulator CckA